MYKQVMYVSIILGVIAAALILAPDMIHEKLAPKEGPIADVLNKVHQNAMYIGIALAGLSVYLYLQTGQQEQPSDTYLPSYEESVSSGSQIPEITSTSGTPVASE
jgi:hypothetical protein